jgi:hypothetical protein
MLCNFKLEVGAVSAAGFVARIRELIEELPDLSSIMVLLLIARHTLRETFMTLHRMWSAGWEFDGREKYQRHSRFRTY